MKTRTFTYITIGSIIISFLLLLAATTTLFGSIQDSMKVTSGTIIFSFLVIIALSGYFLFLHILSEALSEKMLPGDSIESHIRHLVYELMSSVPTKERKRELNQYQQLTTTLSLLLFVLLILAIGFVISLLLPSYLQFVGLRELIGV